MTTSPAIYAALRTRFCAPEHALFFEVANGTGSNIRRYADGLAMNLFPSRGLTLSGFEIKVSRHDWQRELKNPHKAEEGVFKYCDHWWVVALVGVVRKDELPSTWGLLELKPDGKLRQEAAAPRLTAVPMTRNFIAALLRRASEVNDAIVNKLVEAKIQERRATLDKEVERRVQSRLREVNEKIAKIEGIERQLGMSLTDWNAHEGIGRVIKAINATGIGNSWSGVRDIQRHLHSMAETLGKHIAEFDAIAPDVPAGKEKAA